MDTSRPGKSRRPDYRARQMKDSESTTDLRTALSRFASGVTVITTVTGGRELDIHGMTANSFTSVSLNPPLVLVSISINAITHKRILESGRYGISVLERRQPEICHHFSGSTRKSEKIDFVWRDGIAFVSGALAHLACTVWDSFRVEDHTLHVGEVTHFWYQNGTPLLFFSGTLSTDTPKPVLPGMHATPTSFVEP
ncbi:flavin reductase family protein [Lipingzhangella rawalii]|uniref:flavin reductase family protein n=1 Tax=Lipingzhangella rawalii TaxID=2055835 RepID=UPI003898F179